METIFDSQVLENIFIIDSENEFETHLMQQCFDVVGVFVIAIDLKGKITLINKKGRELLGVTREEAIGKNFIDRFVIKKKQDLTSELFERVMDKKTTYPDAVKIHLKTSSRETRVILAKNSTIKDRNKNILGVLISGEDITEYLESEKDLQIDLQMYRVLANSIPNINLYLYNPDLQFMLAEGNEMKNLELNKKHFENKLLQDIPNQKLQKIWGPLFNKALKGKKVTSEYRMNNYYYFINITPLINRKNEVFACIAIVQNITAHKITEKRLKKSKEEAEKANKAKSEFLAHVSHEIRTPLNAIAGFTEQLLKSELTPRQLEQLNIIDKSADHLLSLINDILILSKIEAKQVRFDKAPFKIEYTVKYVYKSLVEKANEKGIRFSYNIDEKLNLVLLGDSFRLRQILINLVNNAIKFTDEGYIEIRCFLKDEVDGKVQVRFDVIDTGVGMSAGNIKAVFEEFKQADSSITKRYGGTGLGLTISKNLIEMQNGSLIVTSQEGIGSTFSFTLPYTKVKDWDLVSREPRSMDPKKLANKKVLLVDDDSSNRLLAETILEKFNCDYQPVSSGAEAIRRLVNQKFDLILLDIHMPGLSGYDVAQYLRKAKKDKKTKIIAVTAVAMKDDIQKFRKSGIDSFLIKPFKEEELYGKMCELLHIEIATKPRHQVEIILTDYKEEPKPYNLKELMKMSDGQKTFVNRMLTTFIENAENAVFLMDQLVREHKWEQIGETAHKLLPSFRHLEVEDTIIKLSELNRKTLIDPDFDSVPQLVEETKKEIEKTISRLKQEIGEN
jgi:PAS domain S-box-containing protein